MTVDVHAHVIVPEITREMGRGEAWRPHVHRDETGAAERLNSRVAQVLVVGLRRNNCDAGEERRTDVGRRYDRGRPTREESRGVGILIGDPLPLRVRGECGVIPQLVVGRQRVERCSCREFQ